MRTGKTSAPTGARPRPIRAKRTYTSQLTQSAGIRRESRITANKVLGIGLLIIAVALVGTHSADHAGALDLLPGDLEDLLIGFPTAGVAGIAGFIAIIWR